MRVGTYSNSEVSASERGRYRKCCWFHLLDVVAGAGRSVPEDDVVATEGDYSVLLDEREVSAVVAEGCLAESEEISYNLIWGSTYILPLI